MTGATIGKVGRIRKEFDGYLNQRVAKIQAKPDLADNDYIYFCVARDEFREFVVNAASGSSAQENASAADIGGFEITVPDDIAEQRAIASVLTSLDDKIDLLDRQNNTFEKLAETLWRQWFVEEAESVQGPLGELLDLQYGRGLKEEERAGNGFPVVGSSGIVGYHNEYLVEGPGVVIGRKGTLGRVMYLFENFFPIDTTYFVKSKSDSPGLFYEYFLLKSLGFEDYNSDSAVPGLNRDIALSTEVNVPVHEKVFAFDRLVATWFAKINANKNQLSTLTQMRHKLLPKLMSGEVRVT
jgi:type I restriction enzyme S subunit